MTNFFNEIEQPYQEPPMSTEDKVWLAIIPVALIVLYILIKSL